MHYCVIKKYRKNNIGVPLIIRTSHSVWSSLCYTFDDSLIFYLCFARTLQLKIIARTKTPIKMMVPTQLTVLCILLHLWVWGTQQVIVKPFCRFLETFDSAEKNKGLMDKGSFKGVSVSLTLSLWPSKNKQKN